MGPAALQQFVWPLWTKAQTPISVVNDKRGWCKFKMLRMGRGISKFPPNPNKYLTPPPPRSWTPMPTPRSSGSGTELNIPAPPRNPLQDLDAEVAELGKILEILTRAKIKKDAKKGKDGDQNPPDVTDKFLAYGLRTLLKRVVNNLGGARAPGILVAFDDLTYTAKTFEGTHVIATNANRIAHALTFWRKQRTSERQILKNVTGSLRCGVVWHGMAWRGVASPHSPKLGLESTPAPQHTQGHGRAATEIT